MSSNKKIAITSAVLILLIIITAASIIAIFAAAQQTVNSEVSVTYRSEYVSGTASAKYYVGPDDQEGKQMHVNGDAEGATSIEFNSRNENQAQTLSPVEKEIKLSEENYFVVFEYYFTNTNSQNVFMATLSTTVSNVKNMAITTATSNDALEDFLTIENSVADISALNLETIVPANGSAYVYVRAEISNLDNDADFNLNFNWDLGKAEPTLEKMSFNLTDGDHYVVMGSEDASGVVVIPAEYGGYPVTEIGSSAFESNKSITSVVIPKGVTKIGDSAFSICESLTSAILPEGLIEIGYGSFFHAGLINIVIPDSVGAITNQFRYSKLKSVTFGENSYGFSGAGFEACENLNEVIINSKLIYDKQNPELSIAMPIWLTDDYGFALSYLKSGTGKVKIWTEIDDGTNDVFNGTNTHYGTFTKSPTTETINGKTYNVYTKN